jgi:DNA-binding NarL/FixJ family response regulator
VIQCGPPHSYDPNTFKGGLVALLPGFEQVVQYGIELFFRRIPWLVEVIVNFGGVDGANGGLSVGVGRQQDSFRVRIDGEGLLKKIHASHSRHALVGEEESDDVVAFLQLVADVERGGTRCSANYAIVLAIVTAQILDYSFKHADVVVDCKQNRLRHTLVILREHLFRHTPQMIRLCLRVRGFTKHIILIAKGLAGDTTLSRIVRIADMSGEHRLSADEKSDGAIDPVAKDKISMNRLILADNQAIFRAGAARVLAMEDDMRIVAQCEDTAKLSAAIDGLRGSIILLSSSMCHDLPVLLRKIRAVGSHVVLVAENSEQIADEIAAQLNGIVCRNVAGPDLVDCVRRVARGQRWVQRANVTMMQAADSVGANVRDRLTPKEMQIVALIVQGCKNKEIALQLATKEQVIKNYLRSIYDKTGVSDRLELALFTIHHRVLAEAAAKAGNLIQMKTA